MSSTSSSTSAPAVSPAPVCAGSPTSVPRARLAAVAAHLPSRYRTMAETRQFIADSGSTYVPPPGMLEELTGVRGVHVRGPGEQASDLAVTAARQALEEAGVGVGEVDLLLFAATGHDMVEPATSHIVAAKLGASCPVFDVKNACNSVLNALETASAFIALGRYRTVLITCGEPSTVAVRRRVPDHETFLRAMPGYTVSDAGAALVLTAGPDEEDAPGLLFTAFEADSRAWRGCTLAAGGSAHGFSTTDEEHTSLMLNGAMLRNAVMDRMPALMERETPKALLTELRRSAFIAVHQIGMPQYRATLDGLQLPADRCMPAVAEYGNCAAASLPLQLVKAREQQRIESGDTVALIGVASGVSFGCARLRL